jgi:hypothetical protein
MYTSGATFTDWEQVEADRRRPLLVDEDFSWSEPPSRRRRSRPFEERTERRRRSEPEYEVQHSAEPTDAAGPAYEAEPGHEPEPDRGVDLEREVDMAWGGRLSAPVADTYEIVPYSFAGDEALEPSRRRTVVITGRGAGYYPAPRRRAETGVAFRERSGLNPDRMAMWAVLLGVALLLGCIAH